MPSEPKGKNSWLFVLLLLLLLVLWWLWKRQPKKEVPVAWTPPMDDASGGSSTGASYYTQYQALPGTYADETIAWLDQWNYQSGPGIVTDVGLGTAVRTFAAGSSEWERAVQQAEATIKTNYPGRS
jgi:hypothetical protein